MKYCTYPDLLSQHGEARILKCRVLAEKLASYCSYAVLRWEEAPKELQDLCSQGGDENWMVITNQVYCEIPSWIEQIDADDPVTFDLKSSLILVGTH